MSAFTKYTIPTQLVINGKVQHASEADVDVAVANAKAALAGPWGTITAKERCKVLLALSDLLLNRKEEFAWLDGITIGKPTTFGIMEVEMAADTFRYYAGWTDKYTGESYPADDGFLKIVRHEPLGVCVGINPWNGPIATMALKLAPALASGNVMIIKPSEKTPFGSIKFASLAAEAGVPDGVIQCLPGAGATGSLLCNHMDVRKVSFTGSTATGRRIQKAAADSNFKRVTLELGGKSPAAVFDDCNFDNAVWWSVMAITQNSGQACFAASRLYVQESIAEKFIESYVKAMKEKALAMGGMDETTTQLGPLADKQQFDRVASFIIGDKGKTKILTGGKQAGTKGYFYEPTVFYDPDPKSDIYKQEIFGPVVCIRTFTDEQDFIKMANDSEFGLMGGVFTQDINRAMRISAQIQSGVVGVNCVSYINIQVPFGGNKSSGIGREMSHYALRVYTEPKTILVNMTY